MWASRLISKSCNNSKSKSNAQNSQLVKSSNTSRVSNVVLYFCVIFLLLVVILFDHNHAGCRVQAQGTKGGSSFSAFNSFTGSGAAQLPATGGSSSFFQQFQQLSPAEQRALIRQSSSSSRRVVQSSQPIGGSSFVSSEESLTGNAGVSPTIGTSFSNSNLGTSGKTSLNSFKSSSLVSPVQQQQAVRRFFSQQQQQQQLTPAQVQEQNFQSMRSFFNSLTPSQQQMYFNRVQSVQQSFQQPQVVPQSYESSFRRVQSVSQNAAPVVTGGFTSSSIQSNSNSLGTGSDYSQLTQQRFPAQSAFNNEQQSFQQQFSRPQAQQFSTQQQQTGNAFQEGLTQEKSVETSSAFEGGQLSVPGSSSFLSSTAQSNTAAGGVGQQFDGADIQQRNGLSEDFTGLAAASINNKWYIMKPVENPSALARLSAVNLTPASTLSSSGQQQLISSPARSTNAQQLLVRSSNTNNNTNNDKSRDKNATNNKPKNKSDKKRRNNKSTTTTAKPSKTTTTTTTEAPTDDSSDN
ncbi:hypothetical protein GZH46_01487 [Fragariocoptes setiger]|uniref:Uncharacterized protein n=1 Tax=Fragariocoptes setiger TaxID=1670756 RepID=A0ABQ7S9B4_9ACAR|nr:hypothetical protein GZH46_01487 [Fragariocoptes setiger]